MKVVNIVLFDNFTALDAFGPAEVFSRFKENFEIRYFSLNGGFVSSSISCPCLTEKLQETSQSDILLIPGGFGTRIEVANELLITKIRSLAEKSEFVLCVCTGSALLAKTGLLDGKKATSNKLAWNWVVEQNKKVDWIRQARWVVDGKYYTSSGITAGIDMSLGFISDTIGYEQAQKASRSLEYLWNTNKDFDLFS
ncbi:MAG: DJ-1/PfpI family protein [Spirochaetales bacterium]|nr:DJ-1/PfpI family protein [Spirochaetales bacterium]